MSRKIRHQYRDPLDTLWLEIARLIGIDVVRTNDAYASSDGSGELQIANPSHLDADDSLAQMIFHELCHSLVGGRDSFDRVDWGLGSSGVGPDVTAEHACLRTQAFLADRFGLREVLAPTTDFRSFFDKLPADPLTPGSAPSTVAAKIAIARAATKPWAPHLEKALESTYAIAIAGRELWPSDSVLAAVTEARPRHPFGGHLSRDRALHCGSCAFRDHSGECSRFGLPALVNEPACDGHELAFDCSDCGACCREGYDSVTIDDDDPVRRVHPDLVVAQATYFEIRRAGNRCSALQGTMGSFSCKIYSDRPRCCAELERGGPHCLNARQRVGLSV